MSLFNGTCSVSFVEPDLTTNQPSCLPLVAAALSMGWKLGAGGQVNLDDVLIGPLHIQDFKRSSQRQVTRQLTWRFQTARLNIEGELMGVDRFLCRLSEDPRLLGVVRKRPNFEHYLNQLAAHCRKMFPSLKVSDESAHDRTLIVPMVGSATWKQRFVDGYENGF